MKWVKDKRSSKWHEQEHRENADWNQMERNMVQVGTEIFETSEKHYHILCELPRNSNMF